jgi:hypothetical protein
MADLESLPLDDDQPSIEAASGGVVVEDVPPDNAFVDLHAYANKWTAELELIHKAVRFCQIVSPHFNSVNLPFYVLFSMLSV